MGKIWLVKPCTEACTVCVCVRELWARHALQSHCYTQAVAMATGLNAKTCWRFAACVVLRLLRLKTSGEHLLPGTGTNRGRVERERETYCLHWSERKREERGDRERLTVCEKERDGERIIIA